ncbi:glo-4 [Symbiodinium sp. CCMP2592]|nr:glo-4 [Symbiodinium sp. CCMP2592]
MPDMAACGDFHTVLIRSHGEAAAFGDNRYGQCEVPILPKSLRYVSAAAGCRHTVLLRSDGKAIAFGANEHGQCDVPPLGAGKHYVRAAAGNWHTVLLCSDGEAIAVGRRQEGQCAVPALTTEQPEPSAVNKTDAQAKDIAVQTGGLQQDIRRLGHSRVKRQPDKKGARQLRYVAVAAGTFHTLLLRSDGLSVACGSYKSQGLIPQPPRGVKYIDVAANQENTLLLRSDGQAIACGPDDGSERQQIPFTQAGQEYVAIAAGAHHSVVLRSDGTVLAFGHNCDGRCNVPPLPAGTCYTSIAAGLRHTVLWRSDGVALAFGSISLPAGCPRVRAGPCDVPPLPLPALRALRGSSDSLSLRPPLEPAPSTRRASKEHLESPFVLDG